MKTADNREIVSKGVYYAVENGKTVVEVKGREVGKILGDELYWNTDVYYVRMNAVLAAIEHHEQEMQVLNEKIMEHATKITALKRDDSLVMTQKKQ